MLILYIDRPAVVVLRDDAKPIQGGKDPNPRTLFRGRGYAGFYQAQEFLVRYAKSHGFTVAPANNRILAGMFVKEGDVK